MPLTRTDIIHPDTVSILRGSVGTVSDSGLDIVGFGAAASDIFGASSRLADPVAASSPPMEWLLTGGTVYSLAVLACLAGFCLLLYHFMPYAATVVNVFRGSLYIEKILDEHNYIFKTFRRLVILLGLVCTGLLLMRYTDLRWGAVVAETIPVWPAALALAAIWAALIVIWAVQNVILRTAGWLTYGSRFTSGLISLRNLIYGSIFILTIPMMLMVSLSAGNAFRVLSVILFTVIGALVIFLLIRTYMLFVGQKISIFYWILYLCAVEILPASFLVILTIRSILI